MQLATHADAPPEGEAWLQEIKLDGYRLLGFVSAGETCLRTRNGKDWTKRIPSLSTALGKLKVQDAVLDMEAAITDAHGKSSFQALQAALGDGGDPTTIVAFVFDLLHLDGKNLTRQPLIERKETLERVLKESKEGTSLIYSSHVLGQGAEIFAKACESGLEGIISKRTAASYESGRQGSWLKIKCTRRQEFIILGYSDARTGGRALGALYLGYHKNHRLTYAGKVGTGFSMKSALDLARRFVSLAVKQAVLPRSEMTEVPGSEWRAIHWLEPTLLCEVRFTEWTVEGRIRHPSFQGLREDKDAAKVRREVPVATTTSSTDVKIRARTENLIVGGITITHPDRVISQTGHVTKGELAEYHAAVSEVILPHVVRRPLSLLRCPSGIGGECFFQRNPGKGLGADVKLFAFNHNGKKYDYLYIEGEKGLIEVVQMGTIELHPWGATIDSIEYPDRMIFDLDPAPEVPFEAVKVGAQDIRRRLESKGLESVLKCTGGKGLHVIVPLAAKNKWSVVKAFAASIADEMVSAAPKAYIATMSKAKREGKIFIDYFRNDDTATAIADYSVRARPGAPVACPVDWKELKKLTSPSQFTMKDVLKRAKRGALAWPRAQTLPQA